MSLPPPVSWTRVVLKSLHRMVADALFEQSNIPTNSQHPNRRQASRGTAKDGLFENGRTARPDKGDGPETAVSLCTSLLWRRPSIHAIRLLHKNPFLPPDCRGF